MSDDAPSRWYHFMFNTYGAWIRGDARGFRDHDHRVHSSGDYHNPPPPDEHAGLRRWTLERMQKDPVRFDASLRREVGTILVEKMQSDGVQMLALAVMGDHVHGLGKMPVDCKETLVGNAKRRSSHTIRDRVPGQVWAKKCLFKPVRDEEQHRRVFGYIVEHAREGAWVWTFRDERQR